MTPLMCSGMVRSPMPADALSVEDLALLRCPTCRTPLILAGGDLAEGQLTCAGGHLWPVRGGLARLYAEAEVQGNDRLLRVIYDGLAPLHDPAVAWVLPLSGTGTEPGLRAQHLARIDLRRLTPRPDGAPLRVLEVGVGTGANLDWVEAALPVGAPYELWGLDLAEGMLRRCRRRRAGATHRVRLVMGDAHALPFPDGAFDRVFHTGATNNYRDPARAVAEMARVARAGTPIVVVDERLDPAGRHSPYHRLMYRLMTFYDAAPRAPLSLVPPGAVDVRDEQLARFFYCLSFRMPEATTRS
jgi:SAM-dependent methyltransferase